MNTADHPVARPLNRLLKMAVLAGAEAAVHLHISRGDDLDARDAEGLTPLMLAASKNKGAVCTLLLSSGANLTLTDPSGRDAMAIARAAGAAQAVAAIEAFLPRVLETPTPAGAEIRPSCENRESPDRSHSVPNFEAPDEGEEPLDLSGWEAEQQSEAPEGDDMVVKVVSALHRTISGHKPVDDSEGWEDIEAYLPERATPLPRADDSEKRERLRTLLLRAIRQGEVPELEVAAICEKSDGSRNDDAEDLLRLVLADVGCETGEWIETTEHFAGDDVTEEEQTEIDEALAFLDDLGSDRNEPFRLYIRDMRRGSLLTADEEILLGQNMERGTASAIAALAAWPQGVAAVLAAAERVKSGEGDAESISKWSGAPFDGSPEAFSRDAELLEDEEDESPAAALSVAARDFLEKAEEIRRLSGFAGKGGADELALKDALAAASLTMSFLTELLASAEKDDGGAAKRFQQAIALYSKARERMTVSNLRLVISVVKRYQGLGLAFDDLVQEGNIGLVKAVERYDWRKGFRFSTYATWWIRQQATRAIADQGKTIRTPVHVHEKILRIEREADEIERATGCRPSAESLAVRLSMPPKAINAFLARREEPVSLYESDENGVSPADALVDSFSPDPFAVAAQFDLRETLEAMLAELGPRMAAIMRLRFGLHEDDSLTLEETGGHFGVTRERIRQIESKVLNWFASPARAGILGDFIDFAPAQKLAAERESSERENAEGGELRPRGRPRKGPKSGDARKGQERPLRSAVDKAVAMARQNGISVTDRRSNGGGVVVRLFDNKEAKARRLARTLVAAGFTFLPGIGFRI